MSLPRRAAIGAVCTLLVGCSSVIQGSPVPPSATAPTGGATTTRPPASCPAAYVPPDPKRPKVTLHFDVADDLHTVAGTEHVQFTPDRPITELVFRLTANTAPTVAAGNKIVITSAMADHGGGRFTFTPAGADPSTQGGLLRIPFAAEIAAGTTVSADLAFTLTLSGEEFDRFGSMRRGDERFAWFGSGQPLLAWERGHGWHTEDMLQFTAESATSEAMDTDLTVTAPAGQQVIMSGLPGATTANGGHKTWTSHGDALRDVSVAVGTFDVRDLDVDGVKVHIGAYSQDELDTMTAGFRRAIPALVARFGPFPFPSLSVARPDAGGGGIEYPSSILMADSSDLVIVHETAHMWFYAMVGDSQAEHAWLDEAFASYAEQLVNGDAGPYPASHYKGRVDRPTASYGTDDRDYYTTTYDKGSAALQEAREAAGADRFDAAIRCYLNANAWRIANPSDLKAALADLPAAVKVLTEAGAF